MSYFRFVRALTGSRLISCAFLASSLFAADPDGAALYQARCAACHDNDSTESRIPKREQIAARSPEAITSAMFDGAMIGQASGLSIRRGARYRAICHRQRVFRGFRRSYGKV